jgi:tight adherence protein C
MGDMDTSVLIFIIIVAIAVVVMALGIVIAFGGMEDQVKDRIKKVTDRDAEFEARSNRGLQNIFSPFIIPKEKKEISRISEKLQHAGHDPKSSLPQYYLYKSICAIVICTLIVLASLYKHTFSNTYLMLMAFTALIIGWRIPNIILDIQIDARKREIINGFPDALDLLVCCSEAGLGLNSALQRVTAELGLIHKALAYELGMVNVEIRAGVDRVDALKNLSRRTGVEDIQGLVLLLCQCSKFGTSVADALRIYGLEFRDKRMQRAEEAAAKLPTKMIFPMMFFIFPTIFIVGIGPAVLGAIRTLSGL